MTEHERTHTHRLLGLIPISGFGFFSPGSVALCALSGRAPWGSPARALVSNVRMKKRSRGPWPTEVDSRGFPEPVPEAVVGGNTLT